MVLPKWFEQTSDLPYDRHTYKVHTQTGSTHIFGDYMEVQGLITDPNDVDIYEFFIEDGWFDDFAIEYELHALSVQADFMIELWLIENYSGQTEQLLVSTNNLNSGGLERDDFQGDWLIDDSGYYEFRITALSGQDCNAHYQLDIWASP